MDTLLPPGLLDHAYADLPQRFGARVSPEPSPSPTLIAWNAPLAEELALQDLSEDQKLALSSGNALPEDAVPIAAAYAGHQFGGLVPQLGDGRAVLLGERVDGANRAVDIQLKGSGPTPFSRGGDGRAWLGPVIREYVMSEAMHALGVPTTRALAAVATGADVWREQPLPGAIITRTARSHIRVGTFVYFAIRGDDKALNILVEQSLVRVYPHLLDAENKALALLKAVIEAQALLVAKWMALGFIHGVMNTDNVAISGETIDYGPCAFMDEFARGRVFSSIDRQGRYAYANQPRIAHWNLAQFAGTLLPVLADDENAAQELAQTAINSFTGIYEDAWCREFGRKLGFATLDDEGLALGERLLDLLEEHALDFTNTFRGLANGEQPPALDLWHSQWSAQLAAAGVPMAEAQSRMKSANPARIPRNHRVEEAISAAAFESDYGPFERLKAALAAPYQDQPEYELYTKAPSEAERVTRTFCGT
ncbi:MAG: YdiU family protein [Pseudomonadota bacterium]